LTFLDFSKFPPTITNVMNVPNTVIGPPSNIAISPDGKIALVANSIKVDSSAAAGWSPESYVHIIDLTQTPPKVVGKVQTDPQPSGLSFTPDGKLAIVANRTGGTVSVLAVNGTDVKMVQSVKVCEPAESASDVAISPDGKFALVSAQKGGYLSLLKIENGKVTATGRKISAFGQPYRVVITPDGELALTAGGGYGNAVDNDALTVIDVKSPQPKTIDYVTIGAAPESIELSPDGQLVVATVMEGSNLAADNPNHSNAGAIVVLQRKGQTYVKSQTIPVGRIPEGVAFTSDGKYLVVECHPDRQLWIFDVKDGRVKDTGQRISTPGMPSSLRAAGRR
jgi:DNA-binding beta-propeller fold protein YncE